MSHTFLGFWMFALVLLASVLGGFGLSGSVRFCSTSNVGHCPYFTFVSLSVSLEGQHLMSLVEETAREDVSR